MKAHTSNGKSLNDLHYQFNNKINYQHKINNMKTLVAISAKKALASISYKKPCY